MGILHFIDGSGNYPKSTSNIVKCTNLVLVKTHLKKNGILLLNFFISEFLVFLNFTWSNED